MLLVGLVGCEIRLCAFVRPRVPCVSCVSRLPPVSFYRYPFYGFQLPLMKRSMELGHVFPVTFGAAVRCINGMLDR